MNGLDVEQILIDIALVTTFVSIFTLYLKLNKIWLRKHKSEVADSVSIVAKLLNLVVVMPFFVKNITQLNFVNLLDDFMKLGSALFFIAIGSGYWVNDGRSIREKFKRAFNLEGKEYAQLAKNLLMPSSVQKIFNVLCLFALVDNELHAKEVKFLKLFAKENNLDYEETMQAIQAKLSGDKSVITFNELKAEVTRFLNASPNQKIITYVRDLIDKIIKADNVITKEEEALSEEINSLFDNYLKSDSQSSKKFNIVLIPQSEESSNAIATINEQNNLGITKKDQLLGSKNAYIVDSYYSDKLAEIMQNEYNNLFNCYVTIEKF